MNWPPRVQYMVLESMFSLIYNTPSECSLIVSSSPYGGHVTMIEIYLEQVVANRTGRVALATGRWKTTR